MVRINICIIAVVILAGDALCLDANIGHLVLTSEMTGPTRSLLLSLTIENNVGNLIVKHVTANRNFIPGTQSIDVDYKRKKLYMYNAYTGSLQRLHFHPEHGLKDLMITTLHSGLSKGNVKVALDWISNNILWTDSTFRWIAILSLQNNGHFAIPVYDVEQPTGIAVDPIHKYMFWSDVGSVPKIERSNLIGTDRRTIISQGIAYPIALDVDIESSKLYWVDSIRDTVERSNLDGTERETFQRLAHTQFFDVAVFSGLVYAIDSIGGTVYTFSTEIGKSSSPLSGSKYTSLAVYAKRPTVKDHCASSPCESICVSEMEGPVCLCREGFKLNSDRRTCTEVTGTLHRALVWSTATDICLADIRGIHDETEFIQSNKTCFNNIGSNITWIAVDSRDRKAIFVDGLDIFIVAIDSVKSKKKRLTSATENVTGLATDWRDKSVYWCQGSTPGTGKINVFSQTTMKTRTLISKELDNPKALLVLPLLRTMIWINGRNGGYEIKKAHMNGTDVQTVFRSDGLYSPKDLTADFVTKRLFFLDANTDLTSVGLDGKGAAQKVRPAGHNSLSLKLHAYKNHLILSDADKVDIISVAGEIITNTTVSLTTVTDIDVIDITEQPRKAGPCDIDNGGCEQICIPLGENRICKCSYGFLLDEKETCSSEPLTDNFMYVSDWTHNKIYQVSLNDGDVRALAMSKVKQPTGLIYSDKTRRIIWSDSQSKYIQSVNIDGTDYKLLCDVGMFNAYPDRLAMDHTTGDIFYTSVTANPKMKGFTGIGVVRHYGKNEGLVGGGVSPRAIAIDPVKRFLFWTDHGLRPSALRRVNIDGTNIVLLYETMGWPNGIAIDITENALYVTDGKSNVIYRCGYEANTCVRYHEDPGVHLMDIKLLGDYLYYTTWNNAHITKLHKTNKTDIAKFANNAEFGRLDAIELYSSSSILPALGQTQQSNNKQKVKYDQTALNIHTDGQQLRSDAETPSSTESTPTKTVITTPNPVAHNDAQANTDDETEGFSVEYPVGILMIVFLATILYFRFPADQGPQSSCYSQEEESSHPSKQLRKNDVAKREPSTDRGAVPKTRRTIPAASEAPIKYNR